MDQMMAQLFAEKLGIDPGQLQQSGDLSSALSNQFSDNPLMAALIGSMMSQAQADDEPAEKPPEYERILMRAKKIIRALKQELATADEMLRYLAEVFGACPICWGQNRLCPGCKGKGSPGSYEPLESELLRWVEPALKRLGMRVAKIE